jgi:hypothetical protein
MRYQKGPFLRQSLLCSDTTGCHYGLRRERFAL